LTTGLPRPERPTQYILSRKDIRGYVGLDLNEQASRTGISRPILALADDDWHEAKALDKRRIDRFLLHVRLNRYSLIALMACGLTYLADVLLR
jgi:hypothetical protein